MTAPAVGIVTIGQSPRTDVVPDIAALLPRDTPVIERGALDDADPAGLARLAPAPGEEVLVSRMRDGTEVAMAETRLLPLVQDAVDHVTGRGAAVVAVLCTGTLPRLRCPVPLLQPGPLVRSLVATAAPGARLGVLVPSADQAAPVRAEWEPVAGPVLVLAASPYGPMKRTVAAAVAAPVILPRTVLAGAIAALL